MLLSARVLECSSVRRARELVLKCSTCSTARARLLQCSSAGVLVVLSCSRARARVALMSCSCSSTRARARARVRARVRTFVLECSSARASYVIGRFKNYKFKIFGFLLFAPPSPVK